MSAGSFDRLARELAAPMPRRRALRLAAGALVAIALPGARPMAASAATTRGWVTKEVCGRGGLTCEEQFGADVTECCGLIDPNDPQSNSTCCPPGECWHHPPAPGGGWSTTCCPEAYRCRGGCCSEGERCVDGECTRCSSDMLCGKQCCDDSEVCANARTSLCCQRAWKRCEAGLKGVVKCCPPKDTCCFNKTTKTAVCCDAQHPCVNGRCKCRKDETKCGASACCTKAEICSNGKCCPKGQVNCGNGRCCDKGGCCGSDCCAKGELCCDKKTCCKKGTVCVRQVGKTAKVCCPTARVIKFKAASYCCPAGTVQTNSQSCCPPGDPECCQDTDPGSDDNLGRCIGVCVRGVCI